MNQSTNNSLSGLRRSLPTPEQWRLDDLATPELVAEVEACPSPEDLIQALIVSLRSALNSGKVFFSQEFVDNQESGDRRASIRFSLTSALFNQMFNGRRGYRAHFWVSPETGDEFNRTIIDGLRDALSDLPALVDGTDRNLSGELRIARIQKSFILDSLRPSLAKIWLVEGVRCDGPKILLEDGQSWRSFLYAGNDARVSLKGGYIDQDGRGYQLKHPWCRACGLYKTGVA